MYNYETLKKLATQIRKQHGIKCEVKDLFALAPANDPFYMGTDTDKENGKWFADLWESFGYMEKTGIHLRRVHYQIISQNTPVMMPNGKPYENTEACWDFLTMASKCARYLEYVDAESFVDRRNPDPKIYANHETCDPEIIVNNDLAWDSFSFPSFPDLPDYQVRDKVDTYRTGRDAFRRSQRYQLEIWCEKSTMNDVLIPLCQNYGVNLVTGVGEQSITSTISLVKRAADLKKPVRVFYVSDFDPAGKSMPVSVSRKAEYYIRKLYPDLDFRLFPVVLTEEQVRQYELPRTPIKDSERRKDRFEEIYGTGAVELDALEALYSGELRKILRTYILRYYDQRLDEKVMWEYSRLCEDLESKRQAIIDEHQEEIDELQAEYNEIKRRYEAQITGIQEKIESVWQAIQDEMSVMKSDIDEYPIPEAGEADELGDGLFNSQRSYEQQLIAYKAFQGKNGTFTAVAEALEMIEEEEPT